MDEALQWIESYPGPDLLRDTADRPAKTRAAPSSQHGRGAGGEGRAHKLLKQYVAQHPGAVGLPKRSEATIEYPFASGDCVDIKFDLPRGRAAVVEIKTEQPWPGAHQCIKYRALLEAERGDSLNGGTVQAILVAHHFDEETLAFAERYGIRTFALGPLK
jgi:RecB family endonuclease NucS